MFTGIIQHIGEISDIKTSTEGKTISITVDPKGFEGFEDVKIGDSIAINGLCTTVVSRSERAFSVNLMNNSLKRSSLGHLSRKNRVNLELAMGLKNRFDGHIVQGHIDSVGIVQKIIPDGFSRIFSIKCDTRYVVERGSITVNGVSLTVSNVQNSLIEVSLIPHTLKNTTFQFLQEGDFLNVEYDILAKYIEKFTLLKDNANKTKISKIDENFLIENGF